MYTPKRKRWQLAQFLEFRWWKRYLRGQDPTDYLRRKQAYWARVTDELGLEIRPGERVLDAGCGPAGIFIHLHDRQEVTALDPLLSSYDRLTIFDRQRYPGVRFVEQALEEAGQLGSFDTIYCFNAINHVADWEASLDVVTRLARAEGRLILTSDVHRHAWLLPLFRAVPGDMLHPQQHPAAAYREALAERGWVIERELLMRQERIFEYRAWVCRRAPVPPRWYSGGSVA
jgi:2-polyprenyl-6-hydroxyphenyl methylase/3-demethylubiquinone-9 3-methyltransferase